VLSACEDAQARCDDSPSSICSLTNLAPSKCRQQHERSIQDFRIVMLIIVDALRYDFAPFFPAIERCLHDSPNSSRLFSFVADAPTTTMQRLKGLTTGGLPTFVDAGRSFDASIDIQEDTWVQQAVSAGWEVSVTGDDTWSSLFPPPRLTSNLPFPSLNVKDIDGCDDHVLQTFPGMVEEAAGGDMGKRSLLVGHFLGVDHIGHRYGIDHPEMSRKIAKMDEFLERMRRRAREIKEEGRGEVLLLFFGDHGQTTSGDHGGATREEVQSLLFAHSTQDFVPPLSAGAGDRERLYKYMGDGQQEHVKMAGMVDVQRVWQTDLVPTLSILLGTPIPFGNLGHLIPSLLPSSRGLARGKERKKGEEEAEEEEDAANALSAIRMNAIQVNDFLTRYQQETFRSLPESFTKEAERKFAGCEMKFQELAGRRGIGIVQVRIEDYSDYLAFVAEGARREWATFDVEKIFMGVCLLFLSAVVSALYLYSRFYREQGKLKALSLPHLLLLLCFLLYCASLFSNSYIISGRAVAHFLSCTCCILFLLHILSRPDGNSRQQEEQEKPRRALPLDSLLPLSVRTNKNISVLLVLLLLRVSLFHTAKSHEKGTLQASSTAVSATLEILLLLMSPLPSSQSSFKPLLHVFSVMLVGFYWSLQLLQLLEASPALLRLGIPRTIYMFAALRFLLSLGRHSPAGEEEKREARLERLCSLLPPFSLIFGPDSPPIVTASLLACFLLTSPPSSTPHLIDSLPFFEFFLFFQMQLLFYGTGHRPTFEGIQYGAAFLGVDDVSVNSLAHFSAFLLTFLNTMGSWIILAPFSSLSCLPLNGIFLQVFASFNLVATSIFVAIERRHLMVWAIFAPKLVFDVTISFVLNVMTMLFVIRQP